MSKRLILWSLFVLIAALLGSCSGDSPTQPDSRELELRLSLEDRSVSSSESLPMTLFVTNRGSRIYQLVLSGCQSNFQIYRGSEKVWDQAAHVTCPTGTTTVVLQVGEALRYQATWNVRDANGQVPPAGTYEARAQFLGSETISSPAVTFTVE